jgi:hypothetical protein
VTSPQAAWTFKSEPQNVEQRISNTQGNGKEGVTSGFEIPWSPMAPPKAGKPCSIFDVRVSFFLQMKGEKRRG